MSEGKKTAQNCRECSFKLQNIKGLFRSEITRRRFHFPVFWLWYPFTEKKKSNTEE